MAGHARSRNRPTAAIILVAVLALGAGSVLYGRTAIEAIFSDAATRLAFQIRDEAAAMQRAGQTTRTFEHWPSAWPNGVEGDYRIEINGGANPPREGHRSIGVARNLTAPTYYATSYHLNFIDVPNDVVAAHRQGEPTLVTLTVQDGKIVLTALR